MPLTLLHSPTLAAALGALAALFALLLAALAGAALLCRRARRDAAAARAKLGETHATLAALREGDRVALAGTLEVTADACASFEDGAPAAATTAAGTRAIGGPAAVSARAGRLRLTLRDGAVEIIGPVEVVAGSREARPGALGALTAAAQRRVLDASGDAPAPAGSLWLRALRAGDAARAAGVLARREVNAPGVGYRDGAAPWALLPAPDEGDDEGTPAVRLAFEGAPTARGALRSAAAGLRRPRGLALGAIAVTALGAGAGVVARSFLAARPPEASATAKPRPRFGDAARCRELAGQYRSALEPAIACSREEDCGFDMRGAQWFELDGCFRLRNLRASTVEADRIAEAWLAEGCVQEFEVCSQLPQTMCREGRCVERPPPPLPEDWVRYDLRHEYTFFGPPDLIYQRIPGDCGVLYSFRLSQEDLSIGIDYDVYFGGGPVDANAQVGVFEARVERGPPPEWWDNPHHHREQLFIKFGDPVSCPPYCLPDWSYGVLTLRATCRQGARCDEALRIAQSFRPF